MKPWERDWGGKQDSGKPWERRWDGEQQESRPAPPSAEEPSMFGQVVDGLKRQAGLTTRYLAEGIPSLATMVGDAANAGINTVFGTNLPPASQALTRTLTRAGVPEPETDAEKLAAAPSRAMAGIIGGRGMFGGIAPSPAPLEGFGRAGALPTRDPAVAVRQSFTDGMAVQNQAAVAGSMAAEAGRQGGMTPGNQVGLSVVASMGAPATIATTGNVLKQTVGPLTSRQQLEGVAGQVLRTQAQNDARALDNLRQRREFVPGVASTTGQVAGDTGLSAFEKLMRQKDPVPFSYQDASNNSARQTHINALDATQSRLRTLEQQRDKVTAKMRDDAFAGATGPVNLDPVYAKIDAAMASPKGSAAESEAALKWIRGRLDTLRDGGKMGAEFMYEFQKDLGQLIAGKIQTENGRIRLSAGVANDIKKELSAQINAVAPGFDRYLRAYSQMSKPIERVRELHDTLGDNLKNITTAAPYVQNGSPLTNYPISQAKLKNIVEDDAFMAQFNTKQRQTLRAVLDDMNRVVRSAQAVRTPGSDTAQNILQERAISSLLGSKLADIPMVQNTAGKVSNLLYKRANEDVQRMLSEAMRDPEQARRLMEAAGGFAPANRLLAPATTGGTFGLLGFMP